MAIWISHITIRPGRIKFWPPFNFAFGSLESRFLLTLVSRIPGPSNYSRSRTGQSGPDDQNGRGQQDLVLEMPVHEPEGRADGVEAQVNGAIPEERRVFVLRVKDGFLGYSPAEHDRRGSDGPERGGGNEAGLGVGDLRNLVWVCAEAADPGDDAHCDFVATTF